MTRHTLEAMYRVYDDDSGEYVEVRPDSDALDMTDIDQCSSDGKRYASIRVPQAALPLLIEALQRRLKDGGAT